MLHFSETDIEKRRAGAVAHLGLADGKPDPLLNSLVRLASEVANAPIGLITVPDGRYQWFKARWGLALEKTAREDAFCNHTLASQKPLIANDTTLDARFAGNPYVVGAPHLRFYAGFPIKSAGFGDIAVGALCVLDDQPRQLTNEQISQLAELARCVSGHIDSSSAFDQIEELAEARETEAALLREALRIADLGLVTYQHGKLALTKCCGETATVLGPQPLSFASAADARKFQRLYRSSKRTTGSGFFGQVITPTTSKRWLRIRMNAPESEQRLGYCGVAQDVTRYKRLLDKASRLADTDPLTNLHNRGYLMRNAESFLKASHRDGAASGVALVDLDGFKEINDCHGHLAGDRCLKIVAGRLKTLKKRGFIVSRPGGDEFAILFKLKPECDAKALFSDVNRRLERPFKWLGHKLQVRASIGLSFYDGDEPADFAVLMNRADLALYSAKDQGKNCVSLFEPGMQDKARARVELIERAYSAVENGDFVLYYQPKIAFETGEHHGYEALLRWRREDGSVAAPGQFAPVFEEPRLMRALGSFVIREAVRQAGQWAQEGKAFGHVAINLDFSQFKSGGNDGAIVDELTSAVAAAGLTPDVIQLEVTEGVLLSDISSEIATEIARLRKAGFKVAFDDFGTGYASLKHLRELEYDHLKIDRSFVQSMANDTVNMAIVKAVIDLARSLKKQVVAEGIETQEQYRLLKEIGCDYAQGYLLGRPAAPDGREIELPQGLE